MIRIILTFLFTWVVVAGGIVSFRSLSGKEKWALAKIIGYSCITASIAVIMLTCFVVLF